MLASNKLEGISESVADSPVFAAGRVLSTVMLESLLASVVHQPSLTSIFQKFANTRYKIDFEVEAKYGIEPCSIVTCSLPKELVNRTFGSMYMSFVQSLGIIPIGLLREVSESGNSLPFVYTNPPYSLILSQTDLIFVLAHPGQLRN